MRNSAFYTQSHSGREPNLGDDAVKSGDDLLKFEIPEIIFGNDSLSQIGQCAARLGGEHVLVVTDPGVAAAGWLDAVLTYVKAERLKYAVFDDVVTNPRDYQAARRTEFYETFFKPA